MTWSSTRLLTRVQWVGQLHAPRFLLEKACMKFLFYRAEALEVPLQVVTGSSGTWAWAVLSFALRLALWTALVS